MDGPAGTREGNSYCPHAVAGTMPIRFCDWDPTIANFELLRGSVIGVVPRSRPAQIDECLSVVLDREIVDGGRRNRIASVRDRIGAEANPSGNGRHVGAVGRAPNE